MNSDDLYSILVPVIRPGLRKIGQARRRKFRLLPPPAGKVVFLGDSITERGQWEEFFPELVTANRGIGGETTSDVLERLDEAIAGPLAVSLMIGTNDLHGPRAGRDLDVIADRTGLIVHRIREQAPEALLLLNSVLPRSAGWASRLHKLNEHYRRIADNEGAHFVDLWPAYATPEGALRREFTGDRLHLSIPGYQPWVETLRPFLAPYSRGSDQTPGLR